jgi:hypothetical protein
MFQTQYTSQSQKRCFRHNIPHKAGRDVTHIAYLTEPETRSPMVVFEFGNNDHVARKMVKACELSGKQLSVQRRAVGALWHCIQSRQEGRGRGNSMKRVCNNNK